MMHMALQLLKFTSNGFNIHRRKFLKHTHNYKTFG